MKKDLELIYGEIKGLREDVIALKAQLEWLKKQINAVATVKIEENGVTGDESYGNLILDEIVSLKNKLEVLAATSKSTAQTGKTASDESNEFSLGELKEELIKLADMLTV